MVTEKPKISTTTLFLVMLAIAVLVFAGLVYAYVSAANSTANTQKSGNVILQPTGEKPTDIYLKALSTFSYDKQEITVKKGSPVRLHFSADPSAGCGRQLVIYGLNVSTVSKNGEEQIVEFTPQAEGTFEYSCGMRMMKPGKLVVVP